VVLRRPDLQPAVCEGGLGVCTDMVVRCLSGQEARGKPRSWKTGLLYSFRKNAER